MKKKAMNGRYIAGGFICVWGMACIIIGILINANNLRLERYGVFTEATISGIQVNSNNDSEYHIVYVDFMTENGDYIVHADLKEYHSSMNIGDTIGIYYNPDNLFDIASEPRWQVTLVICSIGFVVFCIGLGIYFLDTKKGKAWIRNWKGIQGYSNSHSISARKGKHYCHVCNELLKISRKEKVVNSESEEAKDFDFYIGEGYTMGNVKFSWDVYYCEKCDSEISIDNQRRYECEYRKTLRM